MMRSALELKSPTYLDLNRRGTSLAGLMADGTKEFSSGVHGTEDAVEYQRAFIKSDDLADDGSGNPKDADGVGPVCSAYYAGDIKAVSRGRVLDEFRPLIKKKLHSSNIS